MFELHLEIDEVGRAAFRADAPETAGAPSAPLRGDALLDAAREVVWYKDGFEQNEPQGDDALLRPTMPNLMMFLSDVRGRRFKAGVFLGEEVLAAAALFRVAAGIVCAGRYLPALVEEGGGFAARWRPVAMLKGLAPRETAFVARCVDSLVRRARRTALEDDDGRHETVHDAWIAALRSESGRLAWSGEAEARALMRDLASWKAPLAVSAADRAALHFALEPPRGADGTWLLRLAAPPAARRGLVALGQAAGVFPPLKGLRGGAAELTAAEAENFLRAGAQALAAAGFAVEMPVGVTGEHVTAEADLSPCETKKGGGAVAGKVAARLTIRVDGEKVTEQEIKFLLDQGSALVFFRDRWIEVDRNVLREALRALQMTKRLGAREAVAFALGTGRVGRLRVAKVAAHGWLRGLLNELRGEERFTLLPPPGGLKGTLRDYQLRGYSWLAFLARWGFGPCLADDMGLGKTVQTIAFVLHHLEGGTDPGKRRRRVLVVAPVSVTTNWARELGRFAPGLRTMLHQGAERAAGGEFRSKCAAADVVVTGYSLFVREYDAFEAAGFSALVLDEAQMVKNPDTRAARAARAFGAPVKVALTGTPFENSANDLWSIEEVLNPGLLGDRRDFEETFTRSIREDSHGGAAARLRRILEPFMLRRLKTDPGVAAELGEKREVREYCPLSASQRREYEDALAAYRADVASGAPSRGRMLALLTELKLICDGEGKIARLDGLLAEMFANGESCLVFTQYAKVGRMLRAHLQETFGRLFPFLHGGLSPAQREAEIAAFNGSAEPCAFILSLKAGGFGLNLTRATHVVHFDRWWNPAVENQATDRAHRIGQSRTVFVHLLICAGTLEDHVDELLETKRLLANEVVAGGEAFLLKMSADEFDRVVSITNGAF